MKATRWTVPALLIGMAISTAAASAQYYGPQGPPPPPAGYGPGGWDNSPPEFRAIQQQGFHDGIDGARHDFDNHRPPNVNNRDEFRHPHVDGADRRMYRQAFARGYNVGVQHFYGSGPRPY